jgi:hypothetical protein
MSHDAGRGDDADVVTVGAVDRCLSTLGTTRGSGRAGAGCDIGRWCRCDCPERQVYEALVMVIRAAGSGQP